MAINNTVKPGKLRFTPEQLKIAKERNNALEYALAKGYNLVPKGGVFVLNEHDSMVFQKDGNWHWNSQGLHGRALEFIMFYENNLLQYNPEIYVKAVLALAGDGVQMQPSTAAHEKKAAPSPVEKKPFQLPERSPTHKHAFAYLAYERKIAPEIISECLRNKTIFENVYHHRDSGQVYYNAAFVFKNNEGVAVGASIRSTNTYMSNPYKGMAEGSDKAGGSFIFGGSKDAKIACIFEAPIDALSCATLDKLAGRADFSKRYYVASGGTGDSNILSFLKGHPEVTCVKLCHDNDSAGNLMAKQLEDKLRAMEHPYQVSRVLPNGKDFNQELCHLVRNQNAQEASSIQTHKESTPVQRENHPSGQSSVEMQEPLTPLTDEDYAFDESLLY